jgi:hypothetical protein
MSAKMRRVAGCELYAIAMTMPLEIRALIFRQHFSALKWGTHDNSQLQFSQSMKIR